jgi:hypothetical protein
MNNTQIGIVGVLTMLLGAGGTLLLTQEEQNHSYVCTTNNNVVVADRLSSTNVTAYWVVNGTTKSAVCSKGTWKPLSGYINQTEPVVLLPSNSLFKTETIYADGRRVFT